jgi:hypothetical protein
MPLQPIDVLMRMNLFGSGDECQADSLWRLIDRRLLAIGGTQPIDPLNQDVMHHLGWLDTG